MVNLACEAMDPLLRLISAAHLNDVLERAGVLGDRYVQDVTLIGDRPTLTWPHPFRPVSCLAVSRRIMPLPPIPWHLILEDLTETHAPATDWPLPPSDGQCRTILGSLGRLHAAWWEDPRLGVTIGAWLEDAAMDRFIRQVAGHFSAFANCLGDELSGARGARSMKR